DKLEVMLDIEAPDAVALNTGTASSFPRVNEYVLIPGEAGFTVGQIEWITVERSPYPQRKGMRDFGLVDVPFPLRKLSLSPVGVLSLSVSPHGDETFNFSRGIRSFPTVGDPVMLPTSAQLKAVVESGDRRRVKIGTSPLAAGADVTVDPDRIFGRHLAVLGSTGSGKSCSVAGLIRWSLESARASSVGDKKVGPNARFIVLDPNGEYSHTFKDLGAKVFSAAPGDQGAQLSVPLWLWNTDEWASFTQATPKTQRPVLTHALRALRDGQLEPEPSPSHEMRRFLRTVVSTIQIEYKTGNPWGSFPKPKKFLEKLQKLQGDFSADDRFNARELDVLGDFSTYVNSLIEDRSGDYPAFDFSRGEIEQLLTLARSAHSAFGGSDEDALPIDADVPRPFTGDQFIRSVEVHAELLGVTEHVETLLMRVRTLLADSRLQPVIGDQEDVDLADWLSEYIGDAASPGVTVI